MIAQVVAAIFALEGTEFLPRDAL